MIETLNTAAGALVSGAWAHFVQAALVAGLLALIDAAFGRRMGASWRCALWMVFFVKLALPPQLSLPTSPAYWWSGARVGLRPASAPAAAPRMMPMRTPSAPGDWEQSMGEISARASDAAAKPVPAPPAPTWQCWLVLGWLVGAVSLGTATQRRHRRLTRLLAAGEVGGDFLQAAVRRACARTALRGTVAVRVTEVDAGPLVLGLWHPTIFLPRSLVDRLPADQLYAVITHEVCHVRRADLWMAAVQTLFRVLFFYHPAVWWVNARISRLREEATDRAVLADPHVSARSYSLALVEAAALLAGGGAGSRFALGVIETKSQLNKRIKMNLHLPRTSRPHLGLGRLGSLAALALVLVPMAPAESVQGPAAPQGLKSVDPAPLLDRIGRATDAIVAAFNRRDDAGYMAAFSDDALLLPDGERLAMGRAGVGELYLRVPRTLVYEQMVWSQRQVYSIDHWLIETGLLDFRFRLAPQAPLMDEPRAALTIWQDAPAGGLKVKLLAWNRLGDAKLLGEKTTTVGFGGGKAGGVSTATGDFAAVLEAEESFHRLLLEQRPADAAAYYADAATLIAPRLPLLHGRAAITAHLVQPQASKLLGLERQVAHVEGNAEHVLVVNLFRWTFTVPEASVPLSVQGKGVHVWAKDRDGAWRILFDLPNASQPTG